MIEIALLALAVAQTAAPAPPAVPPPAEPAAAAAPDPAWQAYQAGVAKMADGSNAEARRLLVGVLADHPGHPAANAAAGILGSLPKEQPKAVAPLPQPPPRAVPPPPPPPPTTPPALPPPPPAPSLPSHVKHSGAGRTLLVGFQTLHGLAIGVEVCVLLECDDFRAIGPAMGVGTVAGLLGSLHYSRDGISSGEAASINAGTALGFVHAAFIGFAADQDSGPQFATTLLAGQLVGTVAGSKVWDLLGQPSLDDMAFAAGAAGLSLYTTGPAWAGDRDTSQAMRAISAMAIMDGAIVTAWIIRKESPMSWGRGGIIVASAFAGALGGLGVDGLIEGDDPRAMTLVLLMAGGTYTGAIVAALTTRGSDDNKGRAQADPASSAARADDSWQILPIAAPTADGGGVLGVAGLF